MTKSPKKRPNISILTVIVAAILNSSAYVRYKDDYREFEVRRGNPIEAVNPSPDTH